MCYSYASGGQVDTCFLHRLSEGITRLRRVLRYAKALLTRLRGRENISVQRLTRDCAARGARRFLSSVGCRMYRRRQRHVRRGRRVCIMISYNGESVFQRLRYYVGRCMQGRGVRYQTRRLHAQLRLTRQQSYRCANGRLGRCGIGQVKGRAQDRRSDRRVCVRYYA